MSYRVLITDEATDDVFNLVKYIHVDLCNSDAANKLYTNLNREVNNMGDFPLKFADSGIKYRGYIIHKKIYQSYLLFYIISDENQTVYVLRILKDIMNWRNILQKTNIYHFSKFNSHPRFPFCKRVSHFESDLQILYPTFHFCNDFPVFSLAFMI